MFKYLFSSLFLVATLMAINTNAQAPAVGKPAPDIEIAEWVANGLKDPNLSGKTIIVEFWATWCGPCRRIIPHMNEMQTKYGSDDVVFLSISKEPPAKVKNFLKNTEMKTTVAIDNQGKTSRKSKKK